jgi:hypothetical protein
MTEEGDVAINSFYRACSVVASADRLYALLTGLIR